ncbi:MAG: flagellar basal body-associated protein FliL [Burkholderiales bacterium]|nr:flagellar basal body-associated protein FliL [Burkholderiales bacterium]
MAKAPPKQKAPAEQPSEPKPKWKKRRWLTILLLFTVLAGGGAGARFFLQENDAAQAEASKKKEKPPVFLSLESFTVNLQPEAGDQYLQVGLVLKVKDNATVEAVKRQMPEIRNRLLLLLSSKRASEISTVAGKQKLSGEILAEVKQPFSPEIQQQVVDVFFTSFVIQ